MRTEKDVVSDVILTYDPPLPSPLLLCPSRSMPLAPCSRTNTSFSYGVSESFVVLSEPGVQPDLYSNQGGIGGMIPIGYALGQDTRRTSVPLDTSQWSPSPKFIAPYTHSGSELPWVDMGPYVPHFPSADGGNVGTEISAPFHPILPNVAPNVLAIPPSAPTSALIPGFLNSTGFNFINVGTNPDHPTSSSIPAPSSSPSSSKDVTIIHSDGRQLPALIYRPAEKKGLGHPYSHRRTCAVLVDGLRIDKADLYCGASQIIVHECQWAQSSGYCGMWIIGSRSHVGAHIRKWHKQKGADRGECLWDGCTKRMLQGSINRHVVTVHLGEGFSCQGCRQTFSRKDVYDQHIDKEEACKDAGAAMVYGTERRVIDTRQALQRGSAVRYTD